MDLILFDQEQMWFWLPYKSHQSTYLIALIWFITASLGKRCTIQHLHLTAAAHVNWIIAVMWDIKTNTYDEMKYIVVYIENLLAAHSGVWSFRINQSNDAANNTFGFEPFLGVFHCLLLKRWPLASGSLGPQFTDQAYYSTHR